MKSFSIREALWDAVLGEMNVNDRSAIWGEGVESKVAFDYPELIQRHRRMVTSMPISEAGIVGAALGAALVGIRPVVDLSFDDLAPRVMDEVLNQVAKVRFVTGGQSQPAMVIKMDLPPVRCAQTGQRLESLFARIPGLVVAIPSTPSDARALMQKALRSDEVVVIVEDRWISTREAIVDRSVPEFGEAKIVRRGTDATVVTYGYMVLQALDAAMYLEKRGISVEVIDLRTIAPLDADTIVSSVRKTGRMVTLEGGWRTSGVGAELSSVVVERALRDLRSPPERLAARMTHIPTSSALRMKVFPQTDEISQAIERMVAQEPIAE